MAHAFNTRALPLHLGRCLKFALAATQLALRVVGMVVAMATLLLPIHNMNLKVAVALQISALHHMP